MSNIAERLFDSNNAESDLEILLEPFDIPYDYLTWDYYDRSLKLKSVLPNYRLSIEVQKIIFAEGFLNIYVNHTDKWETHYRPDKPEGWRVSYPHRRNDGTTNILLEEKYQSWPQDWFTTGYVKVIDESK